MSTNTRLSEADRARVRHHLGYLQTAPVASISLGFPAAQQAQFLVERAMNYILPEAMGIIVKSLNVLEIIENQQVDALKRLKAQELGNLKLRNSNEERTEQDLLEVEYVRWAMKLANDLGCIPNPFAQRFAGVGGSPGNLPINTGV